MSQDNGRMSPDRIRMAARTLRLLSMKFNCKDTLALADEMLALVEELEKQPMDRQEIDDITEQFTHGKITPKSFYALRDLALKALDHLSDAESGKLPETESTVSVIERCAKVCDRAAASRRTQSSQTNDELRRRDLLTRADECEKDATAIRGLLPSSGSVSPENDGHINKEGE